jgi:hypothetical protein
MSKKRGRGLRLDWIWKDKPVQDDTRGNRLKFRAQTAEAIKAHKFQIAEARKFSEAKEVEEAIRKVAKYIHESQEEARLVAEAEESRKNRELKEAESQEEARLVAEAEESRKNRELKEAESQEEARLVAEAEESRKNRELKEAESQERYKRQSAYTSACTIVNDGTGTFCQCPGCEGLVEIVQIGCNRFTHEGEGGCWRSACLCCAVVFDTAKEVYDHLRRGDELAKRGLPNGCVTNYCKGKGCMACSIDNCHRVQVQPIAFDLFKF